MNAGLSTQNAPSPSVVLPHYAFGAIALIIATVMLFFASDDIASARMIASPKIVSVAHLLLLGWVTVIIYGALYQLIPVVMEVKLFNENLAYFSFGSIAIGISLLVYAFWNPSFTLMKYGGGLVILSVLLFVINAVGSAIKSKSKSIENRFIITSVVWLLITVVFGLTILFNLTYNWIPRSQMELMKIHLSFGLIGWFLMLVMGVGSTLFPMFFIVHKLKKKFLNASYIFINVGLITLTISMYLKASSVMLLISSLLIVVGVLLFVRYNYDAYKNRLRRKLDIGMKSSVFSFILLFISLLFGFLLFIDIDMFKPLANQFGLVAGISLVLGFFTSLIFGQMYKTLPFIVWLQKYQDKVGKFKIPLPGDLYSDKIADYQYYSFAVAIFSLLLGVLLSIKIIIQISAIVFILSSLFYAINTFKIIFHKERVEPLTPIKKSS